MQKRLFSALALVACSGPTEAPRPLSVDQTVARIEAAQDSLNTAIRDFHYQGGRVRYVYTVNFPADSLLPTTILISLQRP